MYPVLAQFGRVDITIGEEGQVTLVAPVQNHRVVLGTVKYLDPVYPPFLVCLFVLFGEP